MIAAAVLVLALVQWLFFAGRLMLSRDTARTQAPFLVSTMVTALLWMSAAAWWSGSRRTGGSAPQIARAGCSAIRDGMRASEVAKTMGAPSKKLSESDMRGPGAEAWVYENAGCVAHVLNNRVRSVDVQ